MSRSETRPPRLIRGFRPLFLSRLAKYGVATLLVCFCLFGIYRLLGEISHLFMLDEAGYGDSYILYDVLHFQKTGYIYRDLSKPPYLPAQYSPMLYILFSLPGRFLSSGNLFVGPRLLVLTAFAV